MPPGTLIIVRQGLRPATYEVRFVQHDGKPSRASLTLRGPESLRPFLDSIGIAPREREDAIRDAIQNGEATIVAVHLNQDSIDALGL